MEELFLSILNMSVTASYVIVIVMLIRLLLKKAPKYISYALWAVVGFRLVLPFSFESVFSLLPFRENPIPQTLALGEEVPFTSALDAALNAAGDAANGGIGTVTVHLGRTSDGYPVTTKAYNSQVWLVFGSYLWLIGIAALLFYSILSIVLLKRHLKGAMIYKDSIYEACNLKTPFVLGFFRPKIYIPSGLTPEEKSYVILHEQTHITRMDHMVKLLAFLILCIHWFNPLVWIAFMMMTSDMEMSCDEKVLQKMGSNVKKAYSNSLLSLAMDKRIFNGSPLAFGEGNVKRRIKNVLNYRRPSLWVTVSAVIVLIGVSIGLMANPEKRDTNEITGTGTGEDSQEVLPMDGSVSYGIIKLANGEAQYAISPLSGDDAELAEDIIMDAMIKSTIWPGVDVKTLKECYLLRVTYNDGTRSDYYAYLQDGEAVLQGGTGGLCRSLDKKLYEKLVTLVEESMAEQKTGIDRTNLDACVSGAILTANAGLHPDSDFATEAHTVLKTVEKGNKTTVYAMVLYLEFNFEGDSFYESGGSHMPVAMTFEKNTAGEYELREYWIPQDGNGYAPSIRKKFPSDIYKDALDTQKYVVGHIQKCYAQAVEHGNIPADRHIARLVETICSSPAEASNPQAYIDVHSIEYREMIYYGSYTLRYCFSLFEQGGQTGLEGHIMAAACRDILGKEDIDIKADTGQEWYDAFKESVKDLRKEKGDDYIRENMPGSWILLQVLDAHGN